MGFSCTIKLGNDLLYAFDMESPAGGLRFQMLTEDLRLNTALLDTFIPLVKAH